MLVIEESTLMCTIESNINDNTCNQNQTYIMDLIQKKNRDGTHNTYTEAYLHRQAIGYP